MSEISQHDDALMRTLLRTLQAARDPVRSPELEQILSIPEAKIRALVSQLRCARVPVASGSRGYWIADNDDDLAGTLRHIEGRIRALSEVAIGLRAASAELQRKKTSRHPDDQMDLHFDLGIK